MSFSAFWTLLVELPVKIVPKWSVMCRVAR